jgi:hypothetical protein
MSFGDSTRVVTSGNSGRLLMFTVVGTMGWTNGHTFGIVMPYTFIVVDGVAMMELILNRQEKICL